MHDGRTRETSFARDRVGGTHTRVKKPAGATEGKKPGSTPKQIVLRKREGVREMGW